MQIAIKGFNISEIISRKDRAQAFILALVLLALVAVYLPHVGKGFVTDDFIWLNESLPDGRIDLSRLLRTTTGFFRPLVGLSFGLQSLGHGTDPLAYGIFNMLLHLLNVILVFLLLRSWERTRPWAAWGAALFALNLKAANMAVGWISGRTELLFSFFLLLSFICCLNIKKGAPAIGRAIRYFLGMLFFLAALLAKETAVAAPLFIFLFVFLNSQSGPLSRILMKNLFASFRAVLPFLAALLVYFLLRLRSDAFTPFNAPSYYRFRFSPLLLLKNIWEYLARSAVLDLLVLVLVMGFFLWKRKHGAKNSMAADRSVIAAGMLWFFCFLLPCLFLESRSDLYAYLPQVGLHLAFLAWLAALARHASRLDPAAAAGSQDRRAFRGLGWMLLLLLLGWSAFLGYRASSRSAPARASRLFCASLARAAQRIPPKKRLLRIVDTQFGEKTAPSTTVGYGLDAMLRLFVPARELRGEFIPIEAAGSLRGRQRRESVTLVWKNGKVRRFGGRRKKRLRAIAPQRQRVPADDRLLIQADSL